MKFTFFDLLALLGALSGLLLGGLWGVQRYGVLGGIGGACAGMAAGSGLRWLPWALVFGVMVLRLRCQSSAHLRASLREETCPFDLVLLELSQRGEDIRQDLGAILEWLASENGNARVNAWLGFMSAFPKVAAEIPDYSPFEPVAVCRRKTETLRGKWQSPPRSIPSDA